MVQDNSCVKIHDEFEKNMPSIILHSNPFDKMEFLNRLIGSIEYPIIFVDLDLLYTGYIESKMIQKKSNVTIFHPDKNTWRQTISDIISKVSEKKILVIIDSLNGVYNMFDNLESTIFVNSCMMLLSSLGCKTNSSVIITGMARKKEENMTWILSPGGKQIIKSSKTGTYFLKKMEEKLILSTLGEGNMRSKMFKVT